MPELPPVTIITLPVKSPNLFLPKMWCEYLNKELKAHETRCYLGKISLRNSRNILAVQWGLLDGKKNFCPGFPPPNIAHHLSQL
jgi:hypothetical protein